MKTLLIVTAVIETGTGLALIVAPSVPVWLLLDTELDAPAALALGRIAGAALLSLGVACSLARNDEQSRAATGLTTAMLLYDTGAAAILAFGGLGSGLQGVGLWPAVALHAGMAVWCTACLRINRVNRS
jgi:hypothetical protein